MKNQLLFLITVLFLLTSCADSKNQEKDKRQPNFIVFIADDAAWNDCGPYGNQAIKTPNINKLAEDGLVFDNAFLTASSCSPSRGSILTGRYPHSAGTQELHMPFPEEQILFPGELQKAGYYTAIAGKYHPGPWRAEFDSIYRYSGEPSGCKQWVKAIQERPKDKPFFLWLASIDPHRDYEPNIIPEPHNPEDVIVPPYLPDTDSIRKDLGLYYDEISRMDSYLGKVMEELKKQGVEDNTLVIYMADNGSPFPRSKTRLYDSGIKTPFIVRWPGVTTKARTRSLVSSIDIAPTFCELAGANIPESFQGVSFTPILYDNSVKTRDHIIGEHNWHDYQAHERAIRNHKFLYIRNAFPELSASPSADVVRSITYQEMIKLDKAGKLNEKQQDCFVKPRRAEELYDVINDPYQFNNLAEDQEYKEALTEMSRLLDTWIKETDDKIPANPTPDKFDRWSGIRFNKS
ncbi:MAG: sulfatase [Maribacter sp.]|nr:sulfatase [Maribacter sp.]